MIGLVGGTFDPIHYGHLRPVQHVARVLGFRATHYVLSARPPHRENPVASIQQRYQMLVLALADYPQFIADDQEIKRRGPSYTVWTLRNLRHRYPDEALCMILGADAYLGLRNWYRWQEVLTLTNIVVMSRPGWHRENFQLADQNKQLRATGGGVTSVTGAPELDFNATGIREGIASGNDTGEALPETVRIFIQQNEIYGTQPI